MYTAHQFSLAPTRDKKVLRHIHDRFTFGNSSFIVGMTESGIHELYNSFLLHLTIKTLPYMGVSEIVTTKKQLFNIVSEVKEIKSPVLLILNLSVRFDVSEILQSFKEKKSDLVCIVFSDIKSLESMLLTSNNDSLIPLKPLILHDTYRYLEELSIRYHDKLSKQKMNTLHLLSGGNIGLLETMFFLAKEKVKLTEDEVLKHTAVQNILAEIIFELGVENTKKLFLHTKTDKSEFFNFFGYKTHNMVFSPLLKKYYLTLFPTKQITTFKLKAIEADILESLKRNKQLSRKQIAQLIWNDEKEYSDWKIDQCMTALADKLGSNHSIKKVKGHGYQLDNVEIL